MKVTLIAVRTSDIESFSTELDHVAFRTFGDLPRRPVFRVDVDLIKPIVVGSHLDLALGMIKQAVMSDLYVDQPEEDNQRQGRALKALLVALEGVDPSVVENITKNVTARKTEVRTERL